MKQKIHLIATGGSIMHNLAIALHLSGHEVTGSDDKIFNPAKDRLASYGLLPEEGWDADRIDDSIDLVVLGMHAKADNPELLAAKKLGLEILSFPEFVALKSKGKQQIVVAGSHGKTTTTSMIMHILKEQGLDFDYLVGALLDGFDVMVRLSDAPIIVLEGDEYLSSTLDRTPKFFHYKPDVAIVTGVAWDHMNVFPTKEIYNEQFKMFVEGMKPSADCFYAGSDALLTSIVSAANVTANLEAYSSLGYELGQEGLTVECEDKVYQLPFFGKHNVENMSAAILAVEKVGVTKSEALKAMETFKGASKRLELMSDKDGLKVYRDFAHAPSKVKASTAALMERYKPEEILCVVELHTYSSMNVDFLSEYKNCISEELSVLLYMDKASFKLKGLEMIPEQKVRTCFSHPNLSLFNDATALAEKLEAVKSNYKVICFMSSGNYGGLDLVSFY